MAALGKLLDRFRPTRPDPDDVARVKAWVTVALALGDEDAVTVSEIACNDPACPGLETVILVMRKGERTRAFKAKGSLVVQTRPAVEAALAAAGE
jgi:hypothetical protein